MANIKEVESHRLVTVNKTIRRKPRHIIVTTLPGGVPLNKAYKPNELEHLSAHNGGEFVDEYVKELVTVYKERSRRRSAKGEQGDDSVPQYDLDAADFKQLGNIAARTGFRAVKIDVPEGKINNLSVSKEFLQLGQNPKVVQTSEERTYKIVVGDIKTLHPDEVCVVDQDWWVSRPKAYVGVDIQLSNRRVKRFAFKDGLSTRTYTGEDGLVRGFQSYDLMITDVIDDKKIVRCVIILSDDTPLAILGAQLPKEKYVKQVEKTTAGIRWLPSSVLESLKKVHKDSLQGNLRDRFYKLHFPPPRPKKERIKPITHGGLKEVVQVEVSEEEAAAQQERLRAKKARRTESRRLKRRASRQKKREAGSSQPPTTD